MKYSINQSPVASMYTLFLRRYFNLVTVLIYVIYYTFTVLMYIFIHFNYT